MDPAFYPSFCTTCMQMNCKDAFAMSNLNGVSHL